MRQFIREHPWQLEIVPAVAMAAAVGSVLFYYLRLAGDLVVLEANSGHDGTVGTLLVLFATLVMFYWVLGLRANHQWVTTEHRKRFNWMALVFQSGMLLYASMSLFLVHVTIMMVNQSTDTQVVDLLFTLLSAIQVAGLGLTAVIEWRRPFVLRHETSEPPPPASVLPDGHAGSYIDTEVDWSWVVLALLMCAVSLLAAVLVGEWATGAALVVGFLAASTLAYRKVTVTAECVLFWCGPVRQRFATADIVEYRALHQELFTWKRLRKTRTLFVTTGRSLELKLRNGMTYRLGMVRPAYACELLSRMMSQRDV